jgi:hypothetical protein
MTRSIFTAFFCLCIGSAIAQPIIKPLAHNALLQQARATSQKLQKSGTTDTLSLPFREDFFQSDIFPDTNRWQNNYVYVNGDFGVNPPSYGVATFDYLDAQGNPYTPLSNQRSPGDSLSSKPIDLTVYEGDPISPADSLYFSFFYQPQGRGEAPGDADRLILQFKNSFGVWQSVWQASGSGLKPFEQVLIPIDSQAFFHKAFQFQFINITSQTGNLNHWHIDYIMIDKGRNINDIFYDDYAIQTKPSSLLKRYAAMPYDHYSADPDDEAADSIFFNVSNLNNGTLNIEVRYREEHEGVVLNSTQFVNNAANVPSRGWEKRRFPSYDFSGRPGENVTIDRLYELREPSVINRFTDNDALNVEQEFSNYFAYDDGTAEGGFGWDSDVPFPAGTGRIAVKFSFNKPDTLWALGFFFNQSREDVSRQAFTLKVWNSLELGGGSTTEELWSLDVSSPVYTNERNGYYLFRLDTPLVMPAGDFYVGWTQIGTFNLNIGWDMNHGYVSDLEGSNPGIYYNILGSWREWNANGSPMIRVFVGSEPQMASTSNAPAMREVRLYPNPANQRVHIKGIQKGTFKAYTPLGQLIEEGSIERQGIDCSQWQNGWIMLQLSDEEGGFWMKKILINR